MTAPDMDDAPAHDAELRRIDAQARARRADAMRTETSSAMDGHDAPWRDRLDHLAVELTARTRE